EPAGRFDPVKEAPVAGPGAGPEGGGPGVVPGMAPMGMGPLPGFMPGDRGPGGFGPGGMQATGKLMGGGPVAAVIDGNRKGYLEVTQQVRRMPVGIVVVVDQSYLQDVLLAFANSPLRFQITQVTWTRFRGTLSGIGPSGGTGGLGGDFATSSGSIQFGGSGDPDIGPGRRPLPPGIGFPPPPPPGSMTPGMNYPGSTSGASIAAESQITSGLVELSVYRI